MTSVFEPMVVDLLFLAWNRKEFTVASLEQIVANTNWDQVATFHVHDDCSDDGTRRYLQNAIRDIPCENVTFESLKLRSPVAVMNRYLDVTATKSGTDAFVKIDNDFIVCPGYLEEITRLAHLESPMDIIGFAPQLGPCQPAPFVGRRVNSSSHIGGIGLIRHRVFDHCRPVPRGRFGWTEHQTMHDWHQRGWAAPDLPCFELDRIPVEPWRSLAAAYVAKGWAREWSPYTDDMHGYWDWWIDLQAEQAAA